MKNLSLLGLAMLGAKVRRGLEEHPDRVERHPIAGVSQIGRGKKPTYHCPN
jgi:lipoate-protein ligase B